MKTCEDENHGAEMVMSVVVKACEDDTPDPGRLEHDQ